MGELKYNRARQQTDEERVVARANVHVDVDAVVVVAKTHLLQCLMSSDRHATITFWPQRTATTGCDT